MGRENIEELLAYNGISPCPADLDAYWDRALAELDAVDPRPEMVPADITTPFASCFHLYFTGVNGARIHAKLLRPHRPDGAALVIFHGYRSNSGLWLDKLGYAAVGMTVAAMDSRGQAGFSEDNGVYHGSTQLGHLLRGVEDGPEHLLFRSILLDTVQMCRVVAALDGVDKTRIGAFGGSQGGGLAFACASLYPALARVAVAYPFLSDYKLIWQLGGSGIACAEIREYFRKYDPRHLKEDKLFETLGYIDVHNLTRRVRARTLMGTGLEDATCPPAAQFAAFNQINAPKEYRLYYDYGHEALENYLDDVFVFMTRLLKP